MRKEVIIAPSLLAADFRNLHQEVSLMLQKGIKYLHFDVMDGHFVPNLSFGIPLLEALRPHYAFIYDVHLMISKPDNLVPQFIKAGADIITFHVEAMENDHAVFTLIKMIKDAGIRVGLSLKPATPLASILPYLPELDLVLVMSVEPGFGGQKFMNSALQKISRLDELKKQHNYGYLIEVDGGINELTGPLAIEAGAEVLVAGSYLFGHDDLDERLEGIGHGTR